MTSGYRFSFPPYPIGWFQVAYSDEVKPGDVRPLQYFGKELVLFRSDTGKVGVLDAYCPHLGAHLGHGGTVVGESVKCPFHAWQFDGSGTCTEVPYAGKIPKAAKIRPWEVRDVNGLIMVWHHPNGDAPTWEIPEFPETTSDEWTEYVVRRWKIRTRNQEMAENAVDCQHFHYLHGTPNHPTATIDPKGHIFNSVLNTAMETPMGPVEGQVHAQMYGFGFNVTRFTGLVETMLVNSVTAIDEEYVDARFAFKVKKDGGADIAKGIGRAFVQEITRQVEQDMPIWENKKHVKPPILAEGDGPISQFRRWCRQFYADPNAIP